METIVNFAVNFVISSVMFALGLALLGIMLNVGFMVIIMVCGGVSWIFSSLWNALRHQE